MRLKCIKLAGFKSFVDPTTVSFPSNLAAVVGPNGCGKSNIIDAVRWVMGESSAKNLRGESMTDVIFNGSVNRKEVGQASIELVFDNSEGKLGGEYASFSEIAIKRKVTREGTSEYFLNGTKCRRRDITDIFLGTGLGPRSYAIIEQGMISRLIEAKPEDLRVFIEEAAGISKYKERRRETENRMRRTRENLERLTDLRDEMERQLQHLERQAKSAEKYKEFKAEERQLKAQLQALQWRGINDKVERRGAHIRDLEVEVESVVTERQSIETNSEKQRDSLTQLNDALNQVQGRYYSLGAEVSRIEQSIKHQQDRGRQLADDLDRVNRDFEEAKSHLSSDSEKVERWQEELEGITPELELAQAQEEESLTALTEAEEAHGDWQQRWDEFNQTAAAPRQQAEVQQSRIQHLELTLQRLQDKIQKTEAEGETLVAGDDDGELDVLREQLAEMEMQGEERQQQLDDLLPGIAEAKDTLQSLNDEQNTVRSDLQTMKGRRASLEALQQAAMGQGESVETWLAGHDLKNAPLAAEQLDVESGWEQAVETVLGDRLQAVSVAAIDQLAESLSSLSKGQLTLVDSANTASREGSLASKLQGEQTLAPMLSSVLTADSLADALSRRSQLQAGESLITREGVWVGPNWVRVARPDDNEQGVIKRQQELQELTDRIAEAEERLQRIDGELQTRRDAIRDMEAQRDQLQREIQQHSRQHGELNSRLSAQQARIEQINTRRERLRSELEEQRSQYRQEQETLSEARAVLAEAIEAMETDSGRREELMRERDELRATLDSARQKARHDKDHAHQLAMRSQSLSAQLESVAQAIARANDQVALLEKRREEIKEALSQSGDPIEEMRLELEERLEQRLVVEEELQEARRKVDGVDHIMRELDRKRNEVETRLQAARSKLEQARLENQELQVRRRTLQEQLAEAQHDLDEVLQSLPEEATEAEWQTQLEQIARRIERLGAINLAAIDEYQSQSERKRYLDAQNDDLIEALETLEAAIRRIDRETRNRFKETFDQVNGGLQELFPRVFGGGSAYLEMTGDDLLDTGIAIMARPPGKKNSTIHLLSGGEKALTAIALVFSIFRLNPAPFCMLDEVDAPLDDANVGRYARMVQEMSDQVQFIFITHNKIAMEMAEQLMGVTMHEPGVSRLVSVDLEEAAEMAAM
ncbi:chromosome segregation protein [Litorivivens lipolytica]|uniref:Chromosome partition protein Smc n=1 Tax=Litorivivens lipolytica TaxID=1524264 RepID=A0A7W4Z467_9GAMM|nr:chromosome segregation protein SMC [Litorivivens lipolytica]MBB3046219.1 chromosome segregation protein [Litorivivens lipolytica]